MHYTTSVTFTYMTYMTYPICITSYLPPCLSADRPTDIDACTHLPQYRVLVVKAPQHSFNSTQQLSTPEQLQRSENLDANSSIWL